MNPCRCSCAFRAVFTRTFRVLNGKNEGTMKDMVAEKHKPHDENGTTEKRQRHLTGNQSRTLVLAAAACGVLLGSLILY